VDSWFGPVLQSCPSRVAILSLVLVHQVAERLLEEHLLFLTTKPGVTSQLRSHRLHLPEEV
jgi:hypothetical protein